MRITASVCGAVAMVVLACYDGFGAGRSREGRGGLRRAEVLHVPFARRQGQARGRSTAVGSKLSTARHPRVDREAGRDDEKANATPQAADARLREPAEGRPRRSRRYMVSLEEETTAHERHARRPAVSGSQPDQPDRRRGRDGDGGRVPAAARARVHRAAHQSLRGPAGLRRGAVRLRPRAAADPDRHLAAAPAGRRRSTRRTTGR